MNKEEVSKKVFNKIHEKKIAMTPKWHFVFFKILNVALLLFLFLLGIFIFSLIYHLIFHFELGGIFKKNSSIYLVIRNLPYFWFLVLGVAVILWVLEFLRTSFGYRIRKRFILISLMAITLVFGIGLHYAGTVDFVDEFMERKMPSYVKLVKTPKSFWVQPKEGLLSGEIVEANSDLKEFVLRDWNGRRWEIYYKKARIPSGFNFENNVRVKIIGEEIEDCCFRAEEIRLWGGKQ